jgi:formylglycine-generating enzyme required for sulfatase activity
MKAILASSLGYTVTRAALRDLVRAELLVENGGIASSPLSLVRSGREILALLSANPGSAVWLKDLLPESAASKIAASAWYKKTIAGTSPLPENDGSSSSLSSFSTGLTVGDAAFRNVSGGEFTLDGAVKKRLALGDFWIARSETGRASWEAFVRENPEWKAENRESLQEQGAVTSSYLEPGPAGGPDGSIGGVSWYAAKAYCLWLGGLLPPAMADWEIRLPREAEWEYAAKLVYGDGASGASSAAEGAAPESMLGGLWEWCEEPFMPLNFFPVTVENPAEISASERSLRGGSWVNPAPSVTVTTRASLPAATCSPFVGFRPVIVRRGTPPAESTP